MPIFIIIFKSIAKGYIYENPFKFLYYLILFRDIEYTCTELYIFTYIHAILT